jgi:hypothetical protein
MIVFHAFIELLRVKFRELPIDVDGVVERKIIMTMS